MDQHQQMSRHPKSSLTSDISHWTSGSCSVPLQSFSRLWDLDFQMWNSPKCLNRLCLTVFSSLRSSLMLVHIFLPNVFLPVNFAFNMLWYSTPWTAPPFSNDPLGFTLFVEGVSDRLLDHCQVSSVPHYCAFKEQEIPRIYTVWMVIYCPFTIFTFFEMHLYLLASC